MAFRVKARSRGKEKANSQDDPDNATDTYGRFFSFRHPGTPSDDESRTKHTHSPNLTADDASPYVLTHTPSNFQKMIGTNYSYGFETDQAQLERNDRDHTKVCHAFCIYLEKVGEANEQWTNPLEVRLPVAPQMKVYCLYGHGKQTEVSCLDPGGLYYGTERDEADV